MLFEPSVKRQPNRTLSYRFSEGVSKKQAQHAQISPNFVLLQCSD